MLRPLRWSVRLPLVQHVAYDGELSRYYLDSDLLVVRQLLAK
jgi:hypothetical protein